MIVNANESTPMATTSSTRVRPCSSRSRNGSVLVRGVGQQWSEIDMDDEDQERSSAIDEGVGDRALQGRVRARFPCCAAGALLARRRSGIRKRYCSDLKRRRGRYG